MRMRGVVLVVVGLGMAATAAAGPLLERVEVDERAVHLYFSTPATAVTRSLAAEGGLPFRIYLDFVGAGLAPDASRVLPGRAPLLRVRTGRFDAGTIRVVLDVGETTAYEVESSGSIVSVTLGEPSVNAVSQERRPPVAHVEPPPPAEPAEARADLPPVRATPPLPEGAPPPVAQLDPPSQPDPPPAASPDLPPAPAMPPLSRTGPPPVAHIPPTSRGERSPSTLGTPLAPGPSAPLASRHEPPPATPAKASAAADPPAAVEAPSPAIVRAEPEPTPAPAAEPAPESPPPVQPPVRVEMPPRPAPRAEFALPRAAGTPPVVVLDAGHGGRDPGAEGIGGVREKDVVLEVAHVLARKLLARLPVRVLMTRTDDSFLPLERRLDTPAEGATLFLSLHANSCPDSSARGLEVFYGGGGVQRTAAGAPPASPGAALLGRCITEALEDRVGAVRGGPRPAGFRVLTQNPAPSVLIEIAYLTHAEDAARTQSTLWRDLLADALVDGVAKFLRVSAPPL
jgi:N-acetylmuramoyl-L-alanine amidase